MQKQANSLNNQILEFLEGKLNYNVGLSLFMRISTDKHILLQLFGLETPEKKEILTEQLQNYYDEENPKQLAERQSESVSDSNQNYSDTPNNVESNENPIRWSIDYRYAPVSDIPKGGSIIVHLAAERKKLYRIRGNLHSDLFNAVSDERRHEIAKDIMKVQFDIDNLHSEMRKVENGLVPERFLRQTRSAVDLVKIQNCQKYIGKFKKKVQEAETEADKIKYQKLLDKHELNLKALINE